MSEWAGKSPVEVDTALAENYYARQRAQSDVSMYANSVRMYAGERKHDRKAPRFETFTEARAAALAVAEEQSWNRASVQRAVEGYDKATAAVARLREEAEPMEAEYRERRWTRAFLVNNASGHVHSSMECSTCYLDRWDPYSGQFKPGTEFVWMTEYSGKPEAEIVSDAGSRACTVCYPSAPVDQPTKMFTPDERSAAERREQAAAKKVERERKRLEKALLPSGEPLVVETGGRFTERLSTLVAGRKWLTDAAWWTKSYADDLYGNANGRTRHPSYPAEAEQVVAEAVAAKEGKSVEDVLAEAAKRAAKRK